MPFNPPNHRSGDPVRHEDINAQNEEIQRLGKLQGSPGITVHNAATQQIAIDIPRRIFIKLTSTATGSAYAWKEVIHASPNSWDDTGYAGTVLGDPAYERQTGDVTLAVDGTVYEAERACCDSAWTFDGKN